MLKVMIGIIIVTSIIIALKIYIYYKRKNTKSIYKDYTLRNKDE